MIICDVCNEWVHVGDPNKPDSCYAKHMAGHMTGCVCLGLRARARCREFERPSCRPREAALKAWETVRNKRLSKGQGGYVGCPYDFFDPMEWSDDDAARDADIAEGLASRPRLPVKEDPGSRPSEPGEAPAAGAAGDEASGGSDSPIPTRARKYQDPKYWPKSEDGQ